MTAHELARRLLAGPNLPVHAKYPAGDYHRTTLAAEVRVVEEGTVRHSNYHQTDRVVEEEDDSEDGDRTVILLD